MEKYYYDINSTLSKQRLFNFVLGPRGVGKTYSFKDRVINNFLKKGQQFVYIRRYDTEMPAAEMRNFFDDVAPKYPEHEFSTFNGLFRIDKAIAGWYFPLSKATMLKSIPFPNVTLIGFDEFIIETGIYHYLPREVTTFLEAYSTISRDRDVQAVFMANAITITNPYFLYFDIRLAKGQKQLLLPEICVEYVDSPAFEEHMGNTRFGKLVSGTPYGDYAINNKFLLDTDAFIAKLNEPASCLCNIKISEKELGMYKGAKTGLIFLHDKPDRTCQTYTLDVTTHDDTTKFIKKSNMYILGLIESFSMGQVRFTSQSVKNTAYNILRGFM